jgi:NitT/TauT family transport system substrate-binding protein
MKHVRGLATLVCAVALATGATSSWAQEKKITAAVTAAADFGSGFLGATEGLFKKRGLDVDFKMVTLNSMIPAMLISDSMQIGGTTTTVMLQAADSGLDLVALAGSGVTDATQDVTGTVTRADLPYSKPEDYIGRKVGVPGIGAFLDVLFRNWLIEKGVDIKKVTFVEVPFPQMGDLLKQGTVDAVVTADPFLTRLVDQKIGKITTNFVEVLKGDLPIIVYSATRKWATANPDVVKAFREAIAEGTIIANRKDKTVRDAVGKYIPMPPGILESMKLARWNAEVTEAGLASWVAIMKKQGLLANDIDVKKLLLK